MRACVAAVGDDRGREATPAMVFDVVTLSTCATDSCEKSSQLLAI